MTTTQHAIVSKGYVTDEEVAAIGQLMRVCNAYEGLDLKLTVPEAAHASDDGAEQPTAFLAYTGDTLVGYCALDGLHGSEVELCGMVHPNHRRRGLARALFEAVRLACRQRGVERILLICEHASISGQPFVARLGAQRAFTELHMERPGTAHEASEAAALDGHKQLRIRRATQRDIPTLVRIMAAAFGDPEDLVRQRVANEIDDPRGPFLLGEVSGSPVGSLKVYDMGPETGIYAVGVLPEHQGHGYGKQLLASSMEMLLARGPTRFALEVDPDNAPALAVYRACGFQETTTYEYFAAGVTSDRDTGEAG